MIQRRIVVLLLIVLLAAPVLSTAAQSRASGGSLDYRQMRGLQRVVWGRHYAPPVMDVETAAIPLFGSPTPGTPMAEELQIWWITVVVHEFDTTANAANAFVQISEGIGTMLVDDYFPGMSDVDMIDIHTEALSGIGTRATLTRPDVANSGSVVMEAVTVQRDQYVYYVSSYGSVSALPTVEVARAIESTGAKDDAEVTFRRDGTSTGGLWGFMPAPGDPALHGLVPIGDAVVYVVPVMDTAVSPVRAQSVSRDGR